MPHHEGVLLKSPNAATMIFTNWLLANDIERARAILIVYERAMPANFNWYFVHWLNVIWDYHKSAPALRLLVYAIMAVDFAYVFDHLTEPPNSIRSTTEVSDFIRAFARNIDTKAFVDVVRTRDREAIQRLILESVTATSEHDPVGELLIDLIGLAVQELELILRKRRRTK
jgi:hypothetical protein